MSAAICGATAACIQVPVPDSGENALDAALGNESDDFASRGRYADPDPLSDGDNPDSRSARTRAQDAGSDAASSETTGLIEPSADGDPDRGASSQKPHQAGEMIINEIMPDPAAIPDSDGEWIELYNPSEQTAFDLRGCAIADGGATEHVIMQPLVIAALSYATIARSDRTAFTPDLVLGFSLANTQDSIALHCGGIEIDRVDYDADFPVTAGASLSLDPKSRSAERNDDASAWCAARVALGEDFGTPGAANPACEAEQGGRAQSTKDKAKPASSGAKTASGDKNSGRTPSKPSTSGGQKPASGSRPTAAGSSPSPPDTSRQPRMRGDLVITEFMADPAAVRDDEGEWIELHNSRDAAFDLQGCSLADGSASARAITRATPVQRGAYLTIARSDRAGFKADLVLDFSLANSSDSIALRCGSTEIDRVQYDGDFSIKPGVSMSLDPQAMDADRNDVASAWCPARVSLGADFGSPGRPNATCDPPPSMPSPGVPAAVSPSPSMPPPSAPPPAPPPPAPPPAPPPMPSMPPSAPPPMPPPDDSEPAPMPPDDTPPAPMPPPDDTQPAPMPPPDDSEPAPMPPDDTPPAPMPAPDDTQPAPSPGPGVEPDGGIASSSSPDTGSTPAIGPEQPEPDAGAR